MHVDSLYKNIFSTITYQEHCSGSFDVDKMYKFSSETLYKEYIYLHLFI